MDKCDCGGIDGSGHDDCERCALILKINEQAAEIERLRLGLDDALLFTNLIKSLARQGVEIYKHDLMASAVLATDRINEALEKETK